MYEGPRFLRDQLVRMCDEVKYFPLKSSKVPTNSFENWFQFSFTCRGTDQPLFVDGYMKIHLRMCQNADKTFINCGTNTHYATANFHLKEQQDKIFDTDEFAHIFLREGHYFHVRPYDTDFLGREFAEASDNLVKNILDLMSCKKCLAYAITGVDDSADANEIEL